MSQTVQRAYAMLNFIERFLEKVGDCTEEYAALIVPINDTVPDSGLVIDHVSNHVMLSALCLMPNFASDEDALPPNPYTGDADKPVGRIHLSEPSLDLPVYLHHVKDLAFPRTDRWVVIVVNPQAKAISAERAAALRMRRKEEDGNKHVDEFFALLRDRDVRIGRFYSPAPRESCSRPLRSSLRLT